MVGHPPEQDSGRVDCILSSPTNSPVIDRRAEYYKKRKRLHAIAQGNSEMKRISINYFLLSGLMSLMFTVGHVLWGQEFVIGQLPARNIDQSLVALVAMGWNLNATTTLLSGIALVMIARRPDTPGVLPLVWFIVAINVARYVMLLGTVLASPSYDLIALVYQSVGLFMYVGCMLLGIRQASTLKQRQIA
jgi:hypothetical protein